MRELADARQKALEDEKDSRQQRDAHLESSKNEMDKFLRLIEANTSKGSAELVDAAKKISEATENLKGAITDAATGIGDDTSTAVKGIGEDAATKLGEAGKKVSDSISEATQEIIKNLTGFSGSLQGLLGDPLQTFATELKNANLELKSHSSEIMKAASTHSQATDQLEISSKTLETASRPISQSIEQIKAINAAISRSLEANNAIMTATKNSVDASMEAMQLSIRDLEKIVRNADNIDEKLGEAFKTITVGLNKSQIEVKEFTDQVHSKFAEGITSIQSVLDGLGDYNPATRK